MARLGFCGGLDGLLRRTGVGFYNGLATFPRIGGTRFADYAAKCEAQD
jgi:hypothetical protein